MIGAACYLVFGGSLPFSGSPFVLKAVFTTQTELHIPSPVRIAGVDVGQVTGVQRVSSSSDAAVVTMDINRNGLPIHADATAKIRPRIFLEGNFYVDLQPGHARARRRSRRAQTLPAAEHVRAGPARPRALGAQLRRAHEPADAAAGPRRRRSNGQPTAAQDATQDPSVRGLTGGQALNLSLKYSADAFKASTIVNEALLGIQPHDLSGVVRRQRAGVPRRWLRADGQLSSLVTHVQRDDGGARRRASRTSARRSRCCRRCCGSTEHVRHARSTRRSAPTQAFAREILPGVKQLDPTIDAALPWIAQATALVSPERARRAAVDR